VKRFNLFGKTLLLLTIIFYTTISADQALAFNDKWSQNKNVSVLFDSYNNVTGVEINGEQYAVEISYTQESLAEMAPAAGAMIDMDHGNPEPLYIEYQDDLYFE
jgi:hypothetical protein